MNNLSARHLLLLGTTFLLGSNLSSAQAAESISDVATREVDEAARIAKDYNQAEFKLVSPDSIELDITAERDLSKAIENDVDRKIRSKYVPVRVSIINKSGKLLKIPRQDVYLINSKGEKISVPSEADIFGKVKRNGIVRAVAWGVPLGLCSFGLLAGPSIAASGAHTKITNGTVKANIQKNCFHGGHLSPEGSVSTMLFIPKKKKDDIRQVALGRVINLEDEVETEKVVDITTTERTTEKKHLAKK